MLVGVLVGWEGVGEGGEGERGEGRGERGWVCLDGGGRARLAHSKKALFFSVKSAMFGYVYGK